VLFTRVNAGVLEHLRWPVAGRTRARAGGSGGVKDSAARAGDRPRGRGRRRLQRRPSYLRESSPEGRREWIAALDTVESLGPGAVIAEHQRAGRHDGPEIIEETRQYIRDFDRIAETTATARELYDQVLALYPERVNPSMLWWSARALKSQPAARRR
jgi:hypothetical protein